MRRRHAMAQKITVVIMIEQLVDILTEVQSLAGKDFSGLGIIICDTLENLPIIPIRSSNAGWGGRSTIDSLVRISSIHSEFHDGFHVLSSKGELTLAAQYFSPPIVKDLKIDRTKRFGGRYLAALFGSTLPGVSATGIASNVFGVAIFQRGAEVYFRSAK